MDTVWDIIYSLFMFIDAGLLKLISWIYEAYLEIANMRILTSAYYEDISSRIYSIVGLIALFMVAYTLLQNIIDPDNKKSDGGMSIVKKIIISFAAVIIIPVFFDLLYGFQESILTWGVIEKIFLTEAGSSSYSVLDFEDASGNVVYTDASNTEYYLCKENEDKEACLYSSLKTCEIELVFGTSTDDADCGGNYLTVESLVNDQNFDLDWYSQELSGNLMASYLLESFITANANANSIIPENSWLWIDYPAGDYTKLLLSANYSWGNTLQYVVVTGDFNQINGFSEKIVDGELDYTVIISTICIGYFAIVLLNFTLDIGLRVIKLAFYQIIAPIPIFMSILPKNEDLLKNWIKIVMTTYAEVFVRVACMSAGIYFIRLVTVALGI